MSNLDQPLAGIPRESGGLELTEGSAVRAKLLAEKGLAIYHVREDEDGEYWAPGHGSLCTPPGWEFLPRGQSFITRQVKKGPHWILYGKHNKKRGYTPVLGVVAPTGAIAAAKALAVETETKRELARVKAAPRRQRKEEEYRRQFEDACLRFLAFAPAHADLARKIAAETAAHACEKHSARVGRTTLLELDKKAALAVRAHIRHNHTSYDEELEKRRSEYDGEVPEDSYRDVRSDIASEIDTVAPLPGICYPALA